jgi:hypothetical protein
MEWGSVNAAMIFIGPPHSGQTVIHLDTDYTGRRTLKMMQTGSRRTLTTTVDAYDVSSSRLRIASTSCCGRALAYLNTKA